MKKKKISLLLTGILTAVFSINNYMFTINAKADTENTGENYDDVFKLDVSNNIGLKADYKGGEENYVALNWNSPENTSQDDSYEYRIYAKDLKNGDEHYHSIPAKGNVNVLNIYPGAGDQLDAWMKEPALELAKDKDFETTYTNPDTKTVYKYNYIRQDGKILTNGMGLLEPDKDGKPYKVNGQYVYAKDEDGNEIKERITVTKTDIRAFNSFNDTYTDMDSYKQHSSNINCLVDADGKYKYDVIYEGGYDCNNELVFDTKSIDIIEKYIDAGRGFLAGHDTIGFTFGTDKNLGRLRDKFAIKVGYWGEQNKNSIKTDDGYSYDGGFIGDTISIKKKGLLTNYPWKICNLKDELTVPITHSTANYAYGDIWMSFTDNKAGIYCRPDNKLLFQRNNIETNMPVELYEHANFYLTTNNNTAMIQTGNSNGNSTPDERKILSNTLFYLCQTTTQTNWNDHYCQDTEAPDKPEIKDLTLTDKINVSFDKVKDNGNSYKYIIESTNEKDNSKARSEEVTVDNVTSQVKDYLVYCDNSKDTTIKDKIESSENRDLDEDNLRNLGIEVISAKDFNGTCSIENKLQGDCYLHVAAMDYAGNISETSSREFYPTVMELKPQEVKGKVDGDFLVDLSVNNINVNNKNFGIHNLNDIGKVSIKIKYDRDYLEYYGIQNWAFKVNRSQDENTITYIFPKVKIKDIASDNFRLLTMQFVPLKAGDTDIIIEEATITDTKGNVYPLTNLQCGKKTVHIDEADEE